MERKWVMVAFGDILGFGVWSRRASNPPEVRDPFICSFYGEVENFLRDHHSIYTKYLGDGFMMVKEISETEDVALEAVNFINGLCGLTKKLLKLIKNCGEPPPESFRMRISTGYATKFCVSNPNEKGREMYEYVSYIVNLAQRLLEVSPEIPFICTEGTFKIFGKKSDKLRIRKLIGAKSIPRGIDSEDIEGLRIIEL